MACRQLGFPTIGESDFQNVPRKILHCLYLQELWQGLMHIMDGVVDSSWSLVLDALERNKVCSTVLTMDMERPSAVIMTMQVLPVLVSISLP